MADKGTGLITNILIMVPDGQISDGKQQFKVQLGQVLTVVRAVLSNADEPPADQVQNDAAWYVRL